MCSSTVLSRRSASAAFAQEVTILFWHQAWAGSPGPHLIDASRKYQDYAPRQERAAARKAGSRSPHVRPGPAAANGIGSGPGAARRAARSQTPRQVQQRLSAAYAKSALAKSLGLG